jgi:tRNA A-37 threonylcarbamoyl transferase component Bud32
LRAILPRLHMAGIGAFDDPAPVLLRLRKADRSGPSGAGAARWRAVWRITGPTGPLCLKVLGPGHGAEDLRREVWMARRAQAVLANVPGVAVPGVVHVFPRRNAILFGWAGGRTLRDALAGHRDGAAALALVRRAGAAMGALHRAEPAEAQVFDASDMIARLRTEDAGLQRRLLRQRRALEAVWAGAGTVRAAACPVHGDAQAHNLIAGDGVLWLVDFANAHRGLPLNDVDAFLADVAALRSRWCRDSGTGPLGHGRAVEAAFLDGYGLPPPHGAPERLLAATQLFGRVAYLYRRRRLVDRRLAALSALLDRRIRALA